MYNFLVSIVPADFIQLLGARSTAGTVMKKCVYKLKTHLKSQQSRIATISTLLHSPN